MSNLFAESPFSSQFFLEKIERRLCLQGARNGLQKTSIRIPTTASQLFQRGCACGEIHTNCPGIKTCTICVDVYQVNWTFLNFYSRRPQNFNFFNFSSLFGREWRKNVQKCKTHVGGAQSHCLCSISGLFFGVLVRVVIVSRVTRLVSSRV